MNTSMKSKIIITALLLAVALPLAAQNPQHEKRQQREITEMVSDLSTAQKKKLDVITDASRKRVDALRARQKAVRDSINIYMRMEGDHSRELFPLFDREARLQCEISREMYTTKVRIDELLTPPQRKQVCEACRRPADRPRGNHRKK